MSAQPVHRRTIEIEAFDEGDEGLRVVGRIHDERPWLAPLPQEHVHDMTVELRVDTDLEITAAQAQMATHPHTECPRITSAYEKLVGMRVGAGWSRQVKQHLAGPNGCAHLEQLCLALAPAILQARTSRDARERDAGRKVYEPPREWARDTCHLWTEGGVIETKIDLGFQPSVRVPGPVPPVEDFRA